MTAPRMRRANRDGCRRTSSPRCWQRRVSPLPGQAIADWPYAQRQRSRRSSPTSARDELHLAREEANRRIRLPRRQRPRVMLTSDSSRARIDELREAEGKFEDGRVDRLSPRVAEVLLDGSDEVLDELRP